MTAEECDNECSQPRRDEYLSDRHVVTVAAQDGQTGYVLRGHGDNEHWDGDAGRSQQIEPRGHELWVRPGERHRACRNLRRRHDDDGRDEYCDGYGIAPRETPTQ